MEIAKKALSAILILAGICALNATEITIEAQQLKTDAGWVLEEPIIRSVRQDGVAEGRFTVDKPGKYFFWIRTKNFGGNWRNAEVFINGKSIGVFGDIFGVDQTQAGWGWSTRKRPVTLKTGENTVKLISCKTTCRVEEIIFSDDAKFDPTRADIAAKNGKKEKTAAGMIADPGHLPICPKLDGIAPRPQGHKGGPKILMLGGMRPWMSNGLARAICNAGADLYLINGTYMGGMCGTSIKITPDDPSEPVPLNYVPYEFNQLDRYKVVFFSALSAENQTKLLAEGRLEQLQKYVRKGGNLLLTVNTPEILAPMAPVELGNKEDVMEGLYVQRPEGNRFAALPEKWRQIDPFRAAMPKPGTRVLSWIVDGTGEKISVAAAIWKYGKGNVLFFNNDYNRRNEGVQFFNWAYRFHLVNALLGEAGGFQLNTPIEKEPHVVPVTIDRAEVALSQPAMKLEKVASTVTVDGNVAKFSNGYTVAVGKKSLSVTYPGETKPYLSNLEFPLIGYPMATVKVDDTNTAEATDLKFSFIPADVDFSVKSITGGDKLTITLANADGSVVADWVWVTGEADVDGRKLAGIGQQLQLRQLGGNLLNIIQMRYCADVDNVRFRRFACYQPPRGYNEYDLSGKVDAALKSWGFFATGQPFTWIEGKKALFCEFPDDVFPISMICRQNKGEHFLHEEISFHFGRRKAPQETALFWHMVTDKKYDTSNDWIALYQFLRHIYRVKAGFPEIPAIPSCAYSNTATTAQEDAIIRASKQFGFKLMEVPLCPTPIEDFTSERVIKMYDRIRQGGLIPYPWHPCCHTPGKSPLVQEHPEWFIHDEKGRIAGYFGGHYRTADMDNPEFRKWYQNVIDTMLAHGVGVCWYDMGGSASTTYNFATPESRVGLWPQMEIYKYYYDKGKFVITEGMNPCVVDGYIFRSDAYSRPLRGREFPFIGASSIRDYLHFDFFRTAMYDYFIKITMDAWVNQFETSFGELDFLQRVKNFLPAVNAALDNGMPFIRETPFGTTWISEKGAALFCFNGVRNLSVALPENFIPVSMTGKDGKTIALNGKMPESVAPETIIVIQKK